MSMSIPSFANDKGDNEVILGAVHKSPGLTAEGNPRKPHLRNRLMKGLCDHSSPEMGSFHPNEVGRIAQHVRKGKGRKEGKAGRA